MATSVLTPVSTQTRIQTRFPKLLMSGVFVSLDAAALAAAVVVGFFLWSLVNRHIHLVGPVIGLPVTGGLIGMALFGLYPGVGLTSVEQIRRASYSTTFVYLLLTASMFITKTWWAQSRGGVFLAWGCSIFFVPVMRAVARALFCSRHWWGVKVLILGAGTTAEILIRNLRADAALGYRPVACLDDDPRKHGSCEGVPVVGAVIDAVYYAQKYGVSCAICAMPGISPAALRSHFRRWSNIFRTVLIVPNLFGISSLWTESRDLGGIVGLEITNNLLKRRNRWLKRAIDILVSGLALSAAWPLIAVAACWIAIVSPGSPFYFQEREGKGQRRVRVFKLRTMFRNADEMLKQHLAAHPAAQAEWLRFCKLRNDPRILPGVGQLLRKTSLDELPQLWNVLKGDMSLVGPRPFPAYHNELFEPDFRALRTQVIPGLTGLWQVSARSNGDLDVQTNIDTYYIRNWSIWLDLHILLRTSTVFFKRSGAC